MDQYRKKWITLAITVFLIFVIGTLGYYFIEDGRTGATTCLE